MYDTERMYKINTWRQKALQGTLTIEETKAIIEELRQGRVAAVSAQKTSRAKSAPVTDKDVDDMLGGLGV